MEILHRRCVVDNPVCSLCSQQTEDVLHSLWSCPCLTQVWNEDLQWSFKNHITFQDFPQLMLHILSSDCSLELFAMQAWTIWFRRNKVRTAPPGFPLNLISQKAYDTLLEYRSVQPRNIQSGPSFRTETKWTPPQIEWYKTNFDAAIFKDDGRAGVGVVIRDTNSLVMASLSQNFQLATSMEEMEATATIRAIELSLELGFDNIIFEGDCETVIKALTDPSPSLVSYGLLIHEAQQLATRLHGISFQHVGREGNKVAHNLARHARHVTGFDVWMEDVPIHCLDIYQADMPLS
ncbi:hypothetical protein SO802_006955 [Lithocarpus litseifolius]|uniref:RNase H type-1 domain-containing protein n=1 Tax=Lithocarpus litseifolius TaxID=425828 RepID=A0AAW2DMP9_9ROSI